MINLLGDCIAQAGRSRYRTQPIAWWTWLAIGIVIGMLVGSPAHAASGCMTISEAREAHPGKHLYWYGEDHCWTAKRGDHHHRAKARHHEARQAARAVPKPPRVQSDAPVMIEPASPRPPREWIYAERWWLS